MVNLLRSAFSVNAVLTAHTLKEISRSTKLYALFINARSGSSWLTEMASLGDRLGTPHEWFNETWVHTDELVLGWRPPRLAATLDINDYVRKTVADYRSRIGIMGVELSIHQALMLIELMESPNEAKRLMTFFYLRRRNIVAQAISLYRSAESGLFHSYQKDPELKQRFDTLDYSADRIEYWVQDQIECERKFENLFERCHIEPHRFSYEDVLVAPQLILEWMEATVTGEVMVPAALPPPDLVLKPVSDEKNRIWETRFRKDHARQLLLLEGERPAFGN